MVVIVCLAIDSLQNTLTSQQLYTWFDKTSAGSPKHPDFVGYM